MTVKIGFWLRHDETLLDYCIIQYSPSREPGQKMNAIKYDGEFVSAQNICGAMTHMDVRRSKAVYQRFLKSCENNAGEHDFEKAAKTIAILWAEHFSRGCEWDMGDRQDL